MASKTPPKPLRARRAALSHLRAIEGPLSPARRSLEKEMMLEAAARLGRPYVSQLSQTDTCPSYAPTWRQVLGEDSPGEWTLGSWSPRTTTPRAGSRDDKGPLRYTRMQEREMEGEGGGGRRAERGGGRGSPPRGLPGGIEGRGSPRKRRYSAVWVVKGVLQSPEIAQEEVHFMENGKENSRLSFYGGVNSPPFVLPGPSPEISPTPQRSPDSSLSLGSVDLSASPLSLSPLSPPPRFPHSFSPSHRISSLSSSPTKSPSPFPPPLKPVRAPPPSEGLAYIFYDNERGGGRSLSLSLSLPPSPPSSPFPPSSVQQYALSSTESKLPFSLFPDSRAKSRLQNVSFSANGGIWADYLEEKKGAASPKNKENVNNINGKQEKQKWVRDFADFSGTSSPNSPPWRPGNCLGENEAAQKLPPDLVSSSPPSERAPLPLPQSPPLRRALIETQKTRKPLLGNETPLSPTLLRAPPSSPLRGEQLRVALSSAIGEGGEGVLSVLPEREEREGGWRGGGRCENDSLTKGDADAREGEAREGEIEGEEKRCANETGGASAVQVAHHCSLDKPATGAEHEEEEEEVRLEPNLDEEREDARGKEGGDSRDS